MLFKYWVVCLLLFILFIQARASSFMPAVTNYLAKDYEAGYQNWACAQGSNGEMYFGNSQGLLVYDGYRWTLHKVPGNHIVRSVYVKEDRIYVGAFEEFGYFKYSEAGTLRYHSLSKFLKNFHGEQRDMEHCRAGRPHLLPVVQRLVLLRREDGTRFPQQTATAALLLHPKRTYLHTDD